MQRCTNSNITKIRTTFFTQKRISQILSNVFILFSISFWGRGSSLLTTDKQLPICIFTLLVSISFTIQWTSKQLNWYGPTHVTPGKVYWMLRITKFVTKKFDFCKILKIHEKNNKSSKFFIIALYYTKRKCSKIEPHLKVKIEDGREDQ